MPLNILIIDDDPAIQAQIAACGLQAATGLDARVTFAGDDASALAALHAEAACDIAFVSIDGGAVSGMALFTRLLERSLRVPRVALTRGHDLARIRAAMADGASDFLVKPLNGDDIIASVRRVLERVERRRRNWSERAAYSALRREVDIAADLQRRILPSDFPVRERLELAACMHPARGIGGDFYDAFAIDQTQVGFVIADVSGKGIPAAFYMAIASTALRSVAQGGARPGQCLSEVNQFLAARDIPGMFVSLLYGIVDTATWQVVCANAGHPPPYRRCADAGGVAEITCDGGPVLGIMSDLVFGETEFELGPGELMVLYTDGVTEAYDDTRQAFGAGRLQALIGDAEATAAATVASIDERIASFTRGAEQHDDLTALVVRRAF